MTAGSGKHGAGIGSGETWISNPTSMSGTITINGNAQVTTWSESSGAGIGSGYRSTVIGNITIGGSAQVTAGNGYDAAGIGAGNNGSIAPGGRIIIRDSGAVTAISDDEGTGVGSGDDRTMEGLIIIQDNAQVTAIAGDSAAAIGSEGEDAMTGTILILGSANVTTGVLDGDGVSFDYDAKEIKYKVDENAVGYIGDGQSSHHESDAGHYVIEPDVTINGVKGSDTEALKDYVNMRLNDSGEPENLTLLDIKAENSALSVEATGEGSVEKVLYGGKETVPTKPGEYPVTPVLRLDDETTIEFEIGTLVVPETTAAAPLYRVKDADGRNLRYTSERRSGVLTITTDADFATLTGKLSGLSTLKAQGVKTIVFVTKGATSTFALSDLLEKGRSGETYCLTHDGHTVTFTLGKTMTDMSEILKEE